MVQTATNPETGEKVALIGGQWVPVTQTATNPETGQRVGFAGNRWVSIGSVTPAAPTTEDPLVRDRQETVARIQQLEAEIAKRKEMQKGRLPGGSAQAITLEQANEDAIEDIGILRRRLAFTDKTGQLPPAPTTGSVISDVLRGIPRSAAAAPGQMLGGLAGLLGSGLTAAGADEVGGAISQFGREAERGGQKFAEDIFGGRSEATQFSPGAAFAAEAGEAIGSTIPYIATEGLGTLAGVATKAGRAATAAGQVPTATRVIRGANYPLAAGQGAGETGQRIEAFREAGGEVTPTQEFFARLGGAGLGLTEVGVINRMIERVPVSARGKAIDAATRIAAQATAGRVAPQATMNSLKQTIAAIEERAVGRIGLSTVEEAGQEGMATFGQNLLEQQIYNPEQELSEDVLKSMALGSIAGGTVRGGAELVQRAIGPRAAPPAPDQEVPPVPPEVRAEFQTLAAQRIAAIMAADPNLTQDQAVTQILPEIDTLVEQARANVEAAKAQEAGAGLDGGDSRPDVDVAGAAEPSVPDTGIAPPAEEVAEGLAPTEPVGVAGTGVPAGGAVAPEAADVGALTEEVAAEPVAEGEYNPDLALAYAAEGSKAKMDYIKPVVSDIFARVTGLDISNPKALPEPAFKALNISFQKVLAATKTKKAIDPEAVVREQLAAFNVPLPEAAAPTPAPAPPTGVFDPSYDYINNRPRSTPAPTMEAPSVTEAPAPATTPPAPSPDETVEAAPVATEEAAPEVAPLPEAYAPILQDYQIIADSPSPEKLDALKTATVREIPTQSNFTMSAVQAPDGALLALPGPQMVVNWQRSLQGEPGKDLRSRSIDMFYDYEGETVPLQVTRPAVVDANGRVLQRGILGKPPAPAPAPAPKKAAPKKAKAKPEGPVFENIAQPNTPEAAALVEEPRNTDIAALAEELPEADRVNVRARLNRITENYAKDGNVERLLGSLEALRQDVERRIDRDRAKRGRDRVRGFERAMEVIYRAERTGQLSPESAALVRWLLGRNPAIAEELAISLRIGGSDSPAGQYNPATRIATIFASGRDNGTAAHEVLHHAERLMPEAVRNGIRAAWRKRINDLIALAERTNNTDMRDVLGTVVQAYYGDAEAQRVLQESFNSGSIPYSVYHLSNPSEFWAVNATDLIGKRAQQTGWLGAARTWLSDFIETVKDLFGLPNEAAIITGLKAVLAAESGTIQGQMLSARTREFNMYVGQAASKATNLSKLAEAQALEAAGALSGPTGTTRAKTGWFRGVDGKWRFEISDRGMMFTEGHTPPELKEGRTYRLGDVIEHPELFALYPDIADTKLEIRDTEGAGGYWDWSRNLIAISNNLPRETTPFLDLLAHEIQHVVQSWEGFTNGASATGDYPISLSAVNKALNFLASNDGKPLFLWNRSYFASDLQSMRSSLEALRDDFGSALNKATEFFNSSGRRYMEAQRLARVAKDEWRAGDHPEAVKLRELTAARIAAAERMQDYSIPMTAEERQVLQGEYEAASAAEKAQYKYVTGLLATGVAKTEAEREFEKDRDEAQRIIEKANNVARMTGANKLMYYLTAGEVEARDTQQRRRETEEGRAEVPPYVAEPFGDISNMIAIDPFSGIASAPPGAKGSRKKPITTASVNQVASAKLTKAQIKRLEEAAGFRRMKMTAMQKRIVRSRSSTETLSLMGKLAAMARSKDGNSGLFMSLFNSIPTPLFQAVLSPQMTDDVVRIANAAGLKNVQRVDDLMRNEYIPYVNRMMLAAANVSETVADFLSRSEPGARALGDVINYSNMIDADPTLAPNATEYFKLDPKLAELKAELANETDPKKRDTLTKAISTRQGEIRRLYAGGVDEKTGETVFGFNDLSRSEFGGGAGKRIYALLRDSYRDSFNEHYRLLMQRINDAKLDPEDAKQLKDAVNKMFADAKKRMVYFPLKRFGEYWVTVGKGKSGEFHMFESASAQEAFVARIKKEGENRDISSGFGRDSLRGLVADKSASAALKGIFDLIEGGKITDIDLLKDHVFQMYLIALPESDMRRRFVHRQFKTGFSTDVLRTFASTSIASANQLGRLAFKYKFDKLLDAGKKETEGRPSKGKLDTLTREMELRINGIMSPDPTNWVDTLLSIGAKGTFYFLLSAPVTAMVNLTQLHIAGLPVLSSEFGEAATATMATRYTGILLNDARVGSPMRDADGNVKLQMPKLSLENSARLRALKKSDPARYAETMKAWRFFNERDTTQSTFAAGADMYERSNKPSDTFSFTQALRRGDMVTAAQRATANTIQSMGVLFHTTERIGREIMVMSAFDLAYERAIKQGKSPADAGKEARELAHNLTNKAMFDFSNWNKSRLAKSKAARLPLQMTSFIQSMSSILFRSFFKMIPFFNKEGKLAAARIFFGINAMAMLYGGLTASVLSPIALGAYGLYQGLKDMLGDEDEEDEVEGSYLTEDTIQQEMLKYADDEGRQLSKKDMDLFIKSVWIPETFGPDGTLATALGIAPDNAAVLEKVADIGLPAVFDVDISKSISLGDLWRPTEVKADDPEAQWYEWLGRHIGPVGTVVTAPIRVVKEMNAGNYDKAFENMLPAAYRNVAKAYRLSEEGLVIGKNRDIVLQDPSFYSTYNLLMQSAGFAEADTSRDMEVDIAAGKVETEVAAEATGLLDRRYRAVIEFERNPTKDNLTSLKRVERDISVYNLNYPSNAITDEAKSKSLSNKSELAAERQYGLGMNPKIPVRQPMVERRAADMLREQE